MRAIRVARTGGPEVLELVELPTPRPGAGEALVRVEAAGVNYVDVYQRKGEYARETPFVPGEEGAGVVEAVGGDAGLRPGDRVAWANVSGSYATHTVAPAAKLVRLPDGVSTRDAAAVMLQGMTAHYLANDVFRLKAGVACLVHAAAGGVGLLLVQMGKRAGARVLGTVSTEPKAALARKAGADDVILYLLAPFNESIRIRTEGRGVDVVYDSVGAATFDRSLLALRPRGLLVLFGQSSGPVPPLDPQVLNARGSLFLTRPKLADYIATRAEFVDRAESVLGGVASQALRLCIHTEFPLARASDAHRALESRTTTGKLLLVPE